MKQLEDQILTHARRLYPTLTDAELRRAAQNLRRYYEVVLEIQPEPMSPRNAGFDTGAVDRRMEERSNPQEN